MTWRRLLASEEQYWSEKRDAYAERHVTGGLGQYYRGLFDVLDVRPPRGGEVVIEIGGGPYPLAAYIDGSRSLQVDPLASHYAAYVVKPLVDTVSAVGENIPIRPDSADWVIALNVLDHVSNPGAVLSESRRIMKSDGLLLIGMDCFDLARRVSWRTVRAVVGPRDPHTMRLSSTQFVHLLEAKGFCPEKQVRYENLGHYMKTLQASEARRTSSSSGRPLLEGSKRLPLLKREFVVALCGVVSEEERNRPHRSSDDPRTEVVIG